MSVRVLDNQGRMKGIGPRGPTGPTGASGAGGTPNPAYFQYLAASLEPDAIEPMQVGTFSYVVAAGVTKLLTGSYDTRFSSDGVMEVRDVRQFLPMRGVTLIGNQSGSTGIIIDPSLPTYANAFNTYYDRLNTLATSTPKYLSITAASQTKALLPGAYGAIILLWTVNNGQWLTLGSCDRTYNTNLATEVTNSGATLALSNAVYFAINKLVCCEFFSPSTASGVKGSVVYVLLPSTWSVIADPNTYNFRDDFMGASLDTATKWNRTQSVTGNVEIDTQHQWLKIIGDGTWTHNGCYSKTFIARANGKVFLCDLYTGEVSAKGIGMVGFHDGAGYDYTDMVHAVYFSYSGGGGYYLQAYENGNARGTIGSGWTLGTVYRVRITLGASNNAKYEIQGGTQYAALGGSTWTDITPGTTSSTTTPLYAGVAAYEAAGGYVSDVRIY